MQPHSGADTFAGWHCLSEGQTVGASISKVVKVSGRDRDLLKLKEVEAARQNMLDAACSGQRGVMRHLARRSAHRQGHWSRASASCCGSTLQSQALESLGSHDGMEPKSAKSDHHNPVSLRVDVNQQASLGLLSDFWTGSTLDPTEADQMLVTFFNQSFLQGWG